MHSNPISPWSELAIRGGSKVFTLTQRSSPPLANQPIPLTPVSEPLVPRGSRHAIEVMGVVCATRSLSNNPRWPILRSHLAFRHWDRLKSDEKRIPVYAAIVQTDDSLEGLP